VRDRLLWLGCLVYAVVFMWLGGLKYAVHRNLVDFGIFAQTAASAFGCFCNAVEGSHWAFHFSPILYPVGVVVAVVRTPLALVALAALAGALAAPPVYGLVRARSSVQAARMAALVTLLYPPLAGLIFGDFHENVFAPAAVLWTLYAFDAGLPVWTLIGAIVTLAIKEDQAIFLAVAGALGAWRFRGTPRGKLSAGIAALGVVVAVAFFAVIAPHAAGDVRAGWQPERFYAWGAADAAGILPGLLARAGFMLLAFVPLLFLPFASGAMWIAVAPLAEVLLSRMPTTFTLGTHYAGAWIGYVLFAFACGVRAMDARRARGILGACIALCCLELLVADPLHPGANLRSVEARDVRLDGALAALPAGVGIATQEEAYTHLAFTNPFARLLPETPDVPTTACLILVDRDFPESARLQEYGPAVSALVRSGEYVTVLHDGGVELYRRTGPCR